MGIFSGFKSMNVVIELPISVNLKGCINFINYKLSRALYAKQTVCVNTVHGLSTYEQVISDNIVEDILVQVHMLPTDLHVSVEHYAKNAVIITIKV